MRAPNVGMLDLTRMALVWTETVDRKKMGLNGTCGIARPSLNQNQESQKVCQLGRQHSVKHEVI